MGCSVHLMLYIEQARMLEAVPGNTLTSRAPPLSVFHELHAKIRICQCTLVGNLWTPRLATVGQMMGDETQNIQMFLTLGEVSLGDRKVQGKIAQKQHLGSPLMWASCM